MSITLSTLVPMGHCNCKSMGFIKNCLFPLVLKIWFMGLVLFGKVTLEDKLETPSSGDIFCISDCATCPVICSPPPISPSVPQSPFYFTFSSPPPPPKSQSPPTPSSHSASPPPPPPPSKSYQYNTPSPSSSSSSQPHPTVISMPHDYYYFYASSAPSLSNHAPFFVLLLFFVGYSFVGNM
ncbi:PREDICTED: leucine-rich repeat extensin-like protein 5 [Lupinus angustifolius]|uniref:leucine-rich repeat extensin-like protein 5 n=1 Tax=Lupinus angustifolius TaxID=3871 RepID=UPI00092E7F33|nr:PREDICTED: leucine-rich repeat extensin-like protein 5 [Lupinus angustifolius]